MFKLQGFLICLMALSAPNSGAVDIDYFSKDESVNDTSIVFSGDWDIDDDGRADALTDGLMFLRYAFGLRGDPLINGLISSRSDHKAATDIERELKTVFKTSGDIDGDGNVDALTDGLLLLRSLFGLSGNSLTTGVIATGATRTDASSLESYIGTWMPAAPYITLNGSAVLDHEQATTYADAGATALDFIDGSVTVLMSGSVDSGIADVYILTYLATDSEGNTAKPVVRMVTVADTRAPVITGPTDIVVTAINGDGAPATATSIVAFLNSATAQDSVDNSVIVYNDAPEIFPLGSTKVTFSATDLSGNKAPPVTAMVLIESFYIDISAKDTVFRFLGRWNFDNPEVPRIFWQGSSVIFDIRAESVKATLEANQSGEQYRIIVNGIPQQDVITLNAGKHDYLLVENLDSTQTHSIEIFKETSSSSDHIDFHGIEVKNGGVLPSLFQPDLKIAFFGDSNMDGTSLYSEKDSGSGGSYYAYPATVSRMLKAEMRLMAMGGATLTGGGNNTIMHFIRSRDWPEEDLSYTDNFGPNVIVVNAGANDIYAVSGSNQKDLIKQRYIQVVNELRAFYGNEPHIILMNAYGWDVKEPASYTHEVLSQMDENVSILLFPWNWEQWHGSMVEHAGQSRLLANHIAALNSQWQVNKDAEIFDSYGSNFEVANGSFEFMAKGGFNAFGWRYHDEGVQRIYDGQSASEGQYFIRLNEGIKVHQGQDASGDFLPGAAKTGQLYKVTAKIRSQFGTATAAIAMDFEGQNLYQRGNTQQQTFNVGSSWAEFSATFSAPADSWKFYLVLESLNGTVDFDDIRVTSLN